MSGRYVVRDDAGFYHGSPDASFHPGWMPKRADAFFYTDRRAARAVAKRLEADGETKRAKVVRLVPKRREADELLAHATAFRFGQYVAVKIYSSDAWFVHGSNKGAQSAQDLARDEAIALARRLDAEEQAKGGGT